MNVNYEKIIKIKSLNDLNKYNLNKPLFKNNYIFHYLIIVGNLKGLKLQKFPVYIENIDGLNCFHLAAKESNMDILIYLIDTYFDYIYNRNKKKKTFIDYLDFDNIIFLMKKYPNLEWNDFLNNENLLNDILSNIKYDKIIDLIKYLKLELIPYREDLDIVPSKYQFLIPIINNQIIDNKSKIKILDKYSTDQLNIKTISGDGLIFPTIFNNNITLFDYLLERNIDVDYYTLFNIECPLRFALTIDILNNTNLYTLKLLNAEPTILFANKFKNAQLFFYVNFSLPINLIFNFSSQEKRMVFV
jgi:hypothetical protein